MVHLFSILHNLKRDWEGSEIVLTYFRKQPEKAPLANIGYSCRNRSFRFTRNWFCHFNTEVAENCSQQNQLFMSIVRAYLSTETFLLPQQEDKAQQLHWLFVDVCTQYCLQTLTTSRRVFCFVKCPLPRRQRGTAVVYILCWCSCQRNLQIFSSTLSACLRNNVW